METQIREPLDPVDEPFDPCYCIRCAFPASSIIPCAGGFVVGACGRHFAEVVAESR